MANGTEDGGRRTEDGGRRAEDGGRRTKEAATLRPASSVLRPLEDRDIVLLFGPPWDQTARVSKHHLTSYLAQRNRVLYVESPPHSLSLLRRPLAAPSILKR